MKRKDIFLRDFNISFGGLKIGLHEYEFELSRQFFESIEYSEIEDGQLDLTFQLEKQSSLLTLYFDIQGYIVLPCDRCTEPTHVDLDIHERLLVKFSDEDFDSEEIVTLPVQAHDIQIAPHVYEFIRVNIPLKVVHEDEADCNSEYLDNISGIAEDQLDETDAEEDIDPRWEALKKLKKD